MVSLDSHNSLNVTLEHQNDNKASIAEFIKSSFKIRECFTYKGAQLNLCICNRPKVEHSVTLMENVDWSYETHTKLRDCDTFGEIKFSGYPDIYQTTPSFVRFDCIENLQWTIYQSYELLKNKWNMQEPSLVISINGGLKKMQSLTNRQKKNFKQGLIDVMIKDKTWIIAGGFNVGIHKLVSEAVEEFRCYYDNYEDHVRFIGICTWGVVKNNHKLCKQSKNRKFIYPFDQNESGKAVLDPHYDCFLFCDDGTEKQYDKEVKYRMKLQKHIEKEVNAFLVQILFEGGRRAIETVHRALRESVAIVVMRGSGRAADLISEIIDIKKPRENEIENKLLEYVERIRIKDHEINDLLNILEEIHSKYKENIVIYDMSNTTLKFEKQIMEAIVKAKSTRPLSNVLELTIKFNCPDVAETYVFSKNGFSKFSEEFVRKQLLSVLQNDQPQFVKLFIENDINLEDIINNEGVMENLYNFSFSLTSEDCPSKELLLDLVTNNTLLCNRTDLNKSIMSNAGKIIQSLSGNILENPYNTNKFEQNSPFVEAPSIERSLTGLEDISFGNSNRYSVKDLFLWALLSGRSYLAEILWKHGRDHVSSALVAATILKNMASLLCQRGDSDMNELLTVASERFENLACLIISEASRKNKLKAYNVLIRSDMKRWNGITCMQLAINGSLLKFLNQSVCKSYIMKVWMGERMSPFTPEWRILISIVCFPLIPSLIISNIDHTSNRNIINEGVQLLVDDNQHENRNQEQISFKLNNKKHVMSYAESFRLFFSTPFVKFNLYLMFYGLFLVIFSYMNLCYLKPMSQVKSKKEMWPEFFVIIYVFSFISEEIRQIVNERRTRLCYKLTSYFSGSWNIFDSLIIFIFIVGLILRFLCNEENFIICRCVYAVSLTTFFLRSMQFFFVSKDIGPKVIMIRNMLKDILFFLSIFGVFILAYGTLSHSLLYPNAKLSLNLLRDIFYLPYFQTYGELMLDQIESSAPCNTYKCVAMRFTVILSFAVFLLFTNVLLINLLIAMFGYTFNQIQDDSEKFWSFIHIQLVQEFYNKPIAPPPFTLLYYIYSIFHYCYYKIKDHTDHKDLLIKPLTDDENFRISSFEQMCTDAVMTGFDTKYEDNDKSLVVFNELNQMIDKLGGVSVRNPEPKKPLVTKKEILEDVLDRIQSTRF